MSLSYETNEGLVRCSACDKPVAKVKGNEIYIAKNNRGQREYVKVEVEHDAGGRFKVNCGCGAFTFATVHKTLPMRYEIAVPKKDDVDKPL